MCFLKVSTREKGEKKLKKDDKLLKVNITTNMGCSDIPTKMLAITEKFTEAVYMSRLCALERGRSLSRLHL
jgi:hypothetical protein